jgi:hypothetical protein
LYENSLNNWNTATNWRPIPSGAFSNVFADRALALLNGPTDKFTNPAIDIKTGDQRITSRIEIL